MPTPQQKVEAFEKYKRSVTQAQIADLLGLIRGENTDLASYEEVAKRLKARQQIEMGIQMVPIKAIVGSVGRYRDFTRTYLPRSGANAERWTRLDAAMNALEGLPPIELFKIGEVYFVRDGNHRVSVARTNGATHIEAYITEVKSAIPLTVDDFERDQWLIKAERAEFLAATKLDELRPDNNVSFTEPGRYALLLHHIEVHRYLRNEEMEDAATEDQLTWEEAVTSWYDNVYMPVVTAIRGHDLLAQFPNRTEADLYLWIAHHRERLARHYELAPLDPETAIHTFIESHSNNRFEQTLKKLRIGLHQFVDEKPLGMSDEQFYELRARHDAGELSLAEAEELQADQIQDEDPAPIVSSVTPAPVF